MKIGSKIKDNHRLLSVPGRLGLPSSRGVAYRRCTAKSILVLKNGHKALTNKSNIEAQLEILKGDALMCVGNTMEKLLENATNRLGVGMLCHGHCALRHACAQLL